MPTTWDIATAVNIALSNGALTATTTGFFVPTGVKATQSQSSGRLYYEATLTSLGSASVKLGVCNASKVFNSGGSENAVSVAEDGTLTVNAVQFGSAGVMGARATGDVTGFATDLDANLFWARVCPLGNWNGNAGANPLTGVGGVPLATIRNVGDPMWPVFISNSGVSTPSVVTANFGDSIFVGINPYANLAGVSAIILA